jgi:hypothetical protein
MKNIGRYAILATYKDKVIVFGIVKTKAEAEKRVKNIKKNPRTEKLGYKNVRYKKL